MKYFTIEDIQGIVLNLLRVFDEYCTKNHLDYSIAGGTLIGAVRDGGFIPWDDDIDIIMPRNDYELLIQHKDDFEFPYEIGSPYDPREKGAEPFVFAYTKLFDLRTTLIEFPDTKRISSHVYIDIFPSDGMPTSERRIRWHYKHAHHMIMLRSLMNASYYRRKMNGPIIKMIFWKSVYSISKLFPRDFFFKILDNYCKKYSIEDSEKMGVIVAGYGIRECTPKQVFYPLKKIHFVNLDVSVMNDYDYFLTQIYGDYMKPPEEANRKANHYYEAYWSVEGEDH